MESPQIGVIAGAEADAIKMLARIDPLTLPVNGSQSAPDDSVSLVLSGGTLTVPLAGLVDLAKERQRLSAEIDGIDANRQRLAKRLSDANFLSKAPEEVIERERQRLADIEARRGRVEEILARLGG